MMAARLLLVLLAGMVLAAVSAYESEIAEWRSNREAALKADGGWLTVAGLFWLHDGANRFGKDASADIVLPDGPAMAGAFELHSGKVTVAMDGATRDVAHDSADVVKVGRLSLLVIKRGDRFGPTLPADRGRATSTAEIAVGDDELDSIIRLLGDALDDVLSGTRLK